MGFKQSLEKSLTKFGGNNSPTVVAMGIATAKGIFRPTFTMMDKKESYETKRYTALREGLTEMIAISVYYLSGVLSTIATKKLADKKYFMQKDVYEKFKEGKNTLEIKNAVKKAEQVAQENVPKLKSTTAFVGVCISALFLIPLICSVTIKPIMDMLDKSKNKKTEAVKQNNVYKPDAKLNTVPFKGYSGSVYGMKVGGV